jgi:geranylgeranyl diphosphate synthase type I
MNNAAPSTSDASHRVASMLARYRQPVIAGLRAALDRPDVGHLRYARYHLGWEDAAGAPASLPAGKMLRPALCLLCAEASGAAPEQAMPAAAAIELLHNFTLIHDDIEDGSESRHGRPTLWRIAGVPQAINAGDGMFAIAQRTLLDLCDAGVPADAVVEASRILTDACVELCEGQHRDLAFEERETIAVAEYLAMVRGKSAALIGAAAALGALVAGGDRASVEQYQKFGIALGLGFQVRDDVLGIWGDPEHTGKSSGDDIRARKKSYPIVYALDRLDAAGRAALLALYAREPRSGDVPTVLQLLDACGARQASERAAAGFADEAVAALPDADPARRADLEALARFAASRDA